VTPVVGTEHSSGRLEPDAVRQMFDRIVPVYDVMNRVMTAGLDRRWRRLAAEAVVQPGRAVLDACCGTGDLAIACARAGGRVTGLDFSERMLERAREKAPSIEWVRGDLLALPFPAGSFDAATVGFGVRNVADLATGFRELRRVLRPGGGLACLEITRPEGALAPFFRAWFDGAVPLLGRVLPGGEAYTYLPASVRRFPGPRDLAALLAGAGFREIRWTMLGGGIVALHTAIVPGNDRSNDRPAGT
jgi:demethylmenaquinone methyltransferase/2-methoxy-6-polyprenyl-1,4-benzoquinol methylase